MRFLATTIALALLVSTTTAQQRPSPGALTPAIESILKTIRAADKGLLAVSEEDGRFLRVMAATRNARSILEIGAASGYSGIWLQSDTSEGGPILHFQLLSKLADVAGVPQPVSAAARAATRDRFAPATIVELLAKMKRQHAERRRC